MRSVQGRRVIVVITDGTDTYSRADLNDAIDIAQRTETTIFAISTKAGLLSTVVGVEAGKVKGKSDKDLDRLAEETGGSAFFTGDMLYARAITDRSCKRAPLAVPDYLPFDERQVRRQLSTRRGEADEPRRPEAAHEEGIQSSC